MSKRKVDTGGVLMLWLCEAKPNKMFSEEQRAAIRFLRYSAAVPCAECGRRKRTLWTALYSFKALNMGTLVPIESDKIHLPMTGVCQSHILKASEWKGAV